MSGASRALITGPTGFIGRALLERETERRWLAVSRSGIPEWAREMENVDWVEVDLTDPAFADSLEDFGVVVHLARSRRQRDDSPGGATDMVEVNVASTAQLLDAAGRAGAERFLLASTATVYRPSTEPLDEKSELECEEPYPATKREAELLLAAGDVPAMALRLFTPYGPGQSGQLIAELIERARAAQPFAVEGERGLLLSPIHVDDIAAALSAALEAPIPDEDLEIVNVGGPEGLGIREIGEAICAELELTARFEEIEGPEPGGYIADNSKAVRLLGLNEPISFREGLRRTLGSDL